MAPRDHDSTAAVDGVVVVSPLVVGPDGLARPPWVRLDCQRSPRSRDGRCGLDESARDAATSSVRMYEQATDAERRRLVAEVEASING